MGYLNLMIVISRLVFLGFGIVFTVVAFSFMKPFVSYSLGEKYQRYKVLYLCILFFHISATALLMTQLGEGVQIQDIMYNSLIFLGILTVGRMLLRVCYRKEVWILWHLVFFLASVGTIMLQRLNHTLATKQVVWIGMGVVGALLVPILFKCLISFKYQWFYLVVTFVMIGLPFVFGTSKNGALNWVTIGPVAFQPSEIGKVTLVLFLAAYFSTFGKHKSKRKALLQVSAIVGVILLGLAIQRDLGSALLYFIVFVVMAYLGTQSLWVPFLGLIGGSVGGILGYLLFDHVKLRVEIWRDPFLDIADKGYQVVQGLFAMGTWGFLGSGLTKGTPHKIPIVETDYIFAAIGEELGNAFAIVVLLVYLALILQGFKIALMQKKPFYTLMAVGITTLLGGQSLIIIGGVLKLIPLTGITLPFISYGGSSIVVSFGMIGILSYLLSESLKKMKKEADDYET